MVLENVGAIHGRKGTFPPWPLQADSFWIARLGLGQGRILLKLFGQKYLIDCIAPASFTHTPVKLSALFCELAPF